MPSVMVALSYPEGSVGILEAALKSAEELGDRSAVMQTYTLMGVAHSFVGHTIEALKFTLKAFEEAEKVGDKITVQTTASRLCLTWVQCGEAARAADTAARAIALLGEPQRASSGGLPEFDQHVSLLSYFGWAKALLGDFGEASRECQIAISIARDMRSQYSLALAYTVAGIVFLYWGNSERLLYYAQEGKRLSEETQIPIFISSGWMTEGWGHYYQDDLSAARECGDKSIALALSDGLAIALAPGYILSGLISQRVPELAKARAAFEEAIKIARDGNQKQYEGQAMICRGRLIIDEDASQMGLAEQTITEGLKMLEGLQLKSLEVWGHLFLGEVYTIAGQKEKALSSLETAHRMFQKMGMDYWLARTEKALEKLKG